MGQGFITKANCESSTAHCEAIPAPTALVVPSRVLATPLLPEDRLALVEMAAESTNSSGTLTLIKFDLLQQPLWKRRPLVHHPAFSVALLAVEVPVAQSVISEHSISLAAHCSANSTGSGGAGGSGARTGVNGGTGGGGGAIYSAGNLALTNCPISGNLTGSGGNGGAGSFPSGASGGDGGPGGGIYNTGIF